MLTPDALFVLTEFSGAANHISSEDYFAHEFAAHDSLPPFLSVSFSLSLSRGITSVGMSIYTLKFDGLDKVQTRPRVCIAFRGIRIRIPFIELSRQGKRLII
jgi:hypothetical protein